MLSPEQLLATWEAGLGQHPIDRALTMLTAVSPGESRAALAGLPLGRRDARLMTLRQRMFGPSARSVVPCLGCGESLDLLLDLREMAAASPAEHAPGSTTIAEGDWVIHLRPVDSRDLAAVTSAASPEAGRWILLDRCARVEREGAIIAAAELPEALQLAIEERIAELDPLAEVKVVARCPSCAAERQVLFDVGEFLWAELAAEARRLLREIDALARAYGWRESEVLALSPYRRLCYLELVSA